jgi:hypothetical protein
MKEAKNSEKEILERLKTSGFKTISEVLKF